MRSDRRAVNPQMSALLRLRVGLASALLRVRGVWLASALLRVWGVGLGSGLFGVGLVGRWPRRVVLRWGCWRGRARV